MSIYAEACSDGADPAIPSPPQSRFHEHQGGAPRPWSISVHHLSCFFPTVTGRRALSQFDETLEAMSVWLAIV